MTGLVRTYKTFSVLAIAALMSFGLSSCSSSRKGMAKSSGQQYLSDDDMIAFKSTYYQAATKKILGDYDEAIGMFRQCLAINPSSAAANYEIGNIMEGEKQSDSALIYVTRAIHLEPSNIWYQELYAQCLEENGKYKEVEDVYINLIKAHPRVGDYYYKLALAQLQSGEAAQAAKTYELSEEKLGFNEQIAMNIVEIYEKSKDYVDAEREIEELIRQDPTVPQYYDMLGNLYDMQGKSDKAFDVYQQMEKEYPNDPMVHLSLADYYRAKHDDKMAFEELKLAFKQPSLDIDTKRRILLTNFYEASTGTDSIARQGMVLCELMVKADPKEPGAHITYGDFLLRSLDFQKALEQYQVAVSEDSSNYIVWEKVMDIDNQLRKYAHLANTSRLVIGLFPDYAYPYLMNGLANFQLKKYDEAINSLRQGVAYVVDDSTTLGQFYSLLGDADNSVKRYNSSDSAYEEALKINPNDDGVLNNYSYYLSLRDTNLAKAAIMSKRSNELAPGNYTYEDTYAWILYKSQNYQEAKEWEDKALQHGGMKDNDILWHYGDIIFKLGNRDGAMEYWQKAKDSGLKSDVLEREIHDKQLYEK